MYGSAGSNDPGATREAERPIREAEQRAAADVLGVKSVTFLGELDGLLEVHPSTRKKVSRELRRLRPDVLIAPDPSRLWSPDRTYINHWDHKQAGLLALTAVMPDVPTRVLSGRDDRMFPAAFQRRVARERLGIDADEIAGGHMVALANPKGLAERLDRYVAEIRPG